MSGADGQGDVLSEELHFISNVGGGHILWTAEEKCNRKTETFREMFYELSWIRWDKTEHL